MTKSRLASAAAKARWVRENDPPRLAEALGEHAEARVSRAIAEASAAFPGMTRERKQRLADQLWNWDGTEPEDPSRPPLERFVRFQFFPGRDSVGEIVTRSAQTVVATFTEGTYKFRQRRDGEYRMVGRPLDSGILEFIDDPAGLL